MEILEDISEWRKRYYNRVLKDGGFQEPPLLPKFLISYREILIPTVAFIVAIVGIASLNSTNGLLANAPPERRQIANLIIIAGFCFITYHTFKDFFASMSGEKERYWRQALRLSSRPIQSD